MSSKFKLKALAAVAAGVLSVGVAQAAFINGSLSISDGGLTLPGLPSTSIVSELTSITQGSPVAANGCTGDFGVSADCFGVQATTSTISIPGNSGTYSWNGFTFTINSITNVTPTALHGAAGTNVLLSDALLFQVSGTVTGGAFDPTAFSGIWTANGSCAGDNPPATCNANASASWSVSLTALGQETTVPEPASIALIGIGLAGLGLARRRKQA